MEYEKSNRASVDEFMVEYEGKLGRMKKQLEAAVGVVRVARAWGRKEVCGYGRKDGEVVRG